MPSKELTRKYMLNRAKGKKPIPSIEEIRRLLGWKLLPKKPIPSPI